MLEKLFRRFAAASHHIVDVKAVPMHHFWLVGLARNLIEIFMLTPQATPCSKKRKSVFLCSLDDHNNKNLYSTNNTFDISAAAVVAAVVAAVKNGLILATIWMMNFARTSFHIFSSRMARTDLLSDLIGGPLRALSILVKAFYRFEIVTG